MCPNPQRRLCGTCQALLVAENFVLVPKSAEHYPDGSAFVKAAEDGCYICSWALRNFRQQPALNRRVGCTTAFLDTWWNQPEAYIFKVIVHDPGDGQPGVGAFQGQIYSESETPKTKLEPSVRSSQTMALAKGWLEDCREHHDECRPRRICEGLPTRLVHVRQCSSGAALVARICDGDTLRPDTSYLTLSHCWGNADFVKTTVESLIQFRRRIPVERLSLTFQDALFVTTTLGFEYIWIDSLCIIQDDRSDWERESQKMGDVYRNAICNLSASGFADGKEGFLLKSRRFDPTPVIATMRGQNVIGSSTIQGDNNNLYLFSHDSPLSEISRGPLFNRAWTLQEQLLASRALHFCEDQVFWECKRTMANEVWPHGWLDSPLWKHVPRADVVPWAFRIAKAYETHEPLYRAWYSIVEAYSSRQLTFLSDRLPALAGIASEFENILRDKYLFGLWSRDLHRGLLFFEKQMRNRSAMAPSVFVPAPIWDDVPSWSWFTLNKAVFWSADYSKSEKNFIRYDSIPICDIAAHNAADTGEILLTGKIVALTSIPYARLTKTEYHTHSHLSVLFQDFYVSLRPDDWFLSNFTSLFVKPDAPNPDQSLEDAAFNTLRSSIVLMPVFCARECLRARVSRIPDYNGPSSTTTIVALMLRLELGQRRGVYRRVGTARLLLSAPDVESEPVDFDTALGKLQACLGQIEEPYFQERRGDGNFTVTLI